MFRRITSLFFLAGLLVYSTGAEAGTLTSEFELNTNGIISLEGVGGIEFNITDPARRANCVTTLLTHSIDPVELRRRCAEEAGVVLGLGIADVQGVRIGHMGHLNPPMILGTLGTMEAAMRSMNAPLGGSGVAAAAEVIGRSLG